MSIHILRLPDVGEGVAEAELVAWHVAAGDTVTSDTVVAEVLTDKATVEITSPRAGTIQRILVPDGTKVPVGTVIVVIGDGGAAPAPATTNGTAASKSPVFATAAVPSPSAVRIAALSAQSIRASTFADTVASAMLRPHIFRDATGASVGGDATGASVGGRHRRRRRDRAGAKRAANEPEKKAEAAHYFSARISP